MSHINHSQSDKTTIKCVNFVYFFEQDWPVTKIFTQKKQKSIVPPSTLSQQTIVLFDFCDDDSYSFRPWKT